MPETQESAGFRFLRESQGDEPWPWFSEHYEQAPAELLDFLGQDGITLEGRSVADVGCGDGIIDLGILAAGRPASLVGFDLQAPDLGSLRDEARKAGVLDGPLPSALEFRTCTPTTLPAADAAFDVVVSWSTFEHVQRPVTVFREIRRVLRPDGFMFLQIWPLYHSQHGSHLWPWFPAGFAHLRHGSDEIAAALAEAHPDRPRDVEFVLEEYRELNRVTVDDLQRAILAAGMVITKFELMTGTVHVDRSLSRTALSDLGISGIKLLAVPMPPRGTDPPD